MKPLLNGLPLLLLMITTSTLFAQVHPEKKQAMFKESADRVPVAVSELEKAFSVQKGATTTIQFSELNFTGTVVNSVKRYENLYSVIIRNKDNNTLLSFSKKINDDLTVTYVGRIINENASDGYELKKETDGTYTFRKIQTDELIQDY